MNPDFIHYNRDENSFTARFFERLVIEFEQNAQYFNKFLEKIEDATKANLILNPNTSLHSPLFGALTYYDSMPFMENIDMYSYCMNNKIPIDIDENSVDKTEFDFVITAKDNEDLVFIVFEVKCFTDLNQEEIERQNHILQKYKGKLYHKFYHIALISYENLERGQIPKNEFKEVVNFSIITWEDVKCFIDYNRIKKDIEFNGLYKTIKLNGIGKSKRYLLKNN